MKFLLKLTEILKYVYLLVSSPILDITLLSQQNKKQTIINMTMRNERNKMIINITDDENRNGAYPIEKLILPEKLFRLIKREIEMGSFW